MKEFKVSVIIPVYNSEKYLSAAIESAIVLPEVGELVLVDDGSTDRSFEICELYAQKGPKINILQHPDKKNHGVSASRNLGIRKANCDYIAFLDSDDYYLPNRFKKDNQVFAQDDSIDGVYGSTKAIFESELVKERFLQRYNNEITTISGPIDPQRLFEALLWQEKGHFTVDAITLKKSIFNRSGLFDERISLGEDTELWYRVSVCGKIVAGSIDEPVAIRRVHGNNHIHTHEEKYNKQQRAYFSKLFPWIMRKKNLSFDQKNIFFMVCRVYKRIFDVDLKEKKFYLRICQTFPELIFNSFMLRKAYHLFVKF